MRLSRNFLSDYIDTTELDWQDVANRMVFAGNEYESIEKLSSAEGIVVGKVIECKMHPESDHLHLCKIDVGSEVLDIVCGAPNMKEGIKVMVAKVGAKLPGGVEIKKAHLAGYDSCGMCCSLSELGIDTKYQSEEDKAGIHILDEKAPLGTDAIAYLGLDDEIIDFELTADRGDLLSILGMAYEVGALYGLKVHTPSLTYTDTTEEFVKDGSIQVKTKKCSFYTAKKVCNITIGESPSWMKMRLIASGIRPINNVVDISNYVMLEYGQPLHFFDADKLGNDIIVRNAKEGEELTTLDGVTRTLSSSDLVIANKKEAVALAGVMGGLDTEITDETKNVIIESAIFDPVTIRYTSKKVLRSEASNRYEKGIDPNRTEQALYRACHLLEKYAFGKVEKGHLKYDEENHKAKQIGISLEKIQKVLGMPLTKEEVIDCLTRLGFSQVEKDGTFMVLVPTRRMDVNIKEDLIEEIGRIYGFDHVKGSLPVTKVKEGRYQSRIQFEKKIKHHLSACGLQEVITYTLVSKKKSELFVTDTSNRISILDPMSEDRKYLRKSLLASLLEVYDYNSKRSKKDLAIFEVANTYVKNEEYDETRKIAALIAGDYFSSPWQQVSVKANFYTLKGMIESLLKYLGISENRYVFKRSMVKDLHPGRCATLFIDGTEVGFLGQVHPMVSKKEIYVMELSMDALFAVKVRSIKYKEVNKYPSIVKDMAFVVDQGVTSEEILRSIKKAGGHMLTEVSVFDVYIGENVEANEKSIAYKLTFEDATRTLTDEEVMKTFHHIVDEVTKNCKATLRDK